jgi:hypothetical protein
MLTGTTCLRRGRSTGTDLAHLHILIILLYAQGFGLPLNDLDPK